MRTRVEREKGLQGELDASNERKKSLLMSHDTRESEHDDHREQRRQERKQDRLHWTVETFVRVPPPYMTVVHISHVP